MSTTEALTDVADGGQRRGLVLHRDLAHVRQQSPHLLVAASRSVHVAPAAAAVAGVVQVVGMHVQVYVRHTRQLQRPDHTGIDAAHLHTLPAASSHTSVMLGISLGLRALQRWTSEAGGDAGAPSRGVGVIHITLGGNARGVVPERARRTRV
jgi:hypothetical protein